ncbi:CHASE2 domain-containing protein [Thermoleptolyngbya sp. C42_A2020_037]|uniref:CHASE2 domain-containing protein n=1 Tax=Thermoleptolyngbya sp. C42_A2020_037 TaxID=2747799 RepID=UPI001A0952B9|nr:CHASE2 domain-containing protein [Thermoleptolyngbya sp. C42_A2020_037]MBF2086343.1 CHASE2 domain-containing protein [Thermoleptolyngbya sp. C42_A2020_037]
MDKLVTLRFGEGSFEQGFPATLQVGEETDAASGLAMQLTTEVVGKLPPAPEVVALYQQWQTAYRQLGIATRLNAPDHQIKNVSRSASRAACQQAARQLRDRLNEWLRAESFRRVRETWFAALSPTDTVRLIVQTEDRLLQRLPWHLLELFEQHSHLEIALSAPTYQRVLQPPKPKGKVRILAILGNSAGIDVQGDRTLLMHLSPQADVTFLVEPDRKELSDRLWDQPWDILFFAGHSSTELAADAADGDTGRIAINPSDSLTIEELHYALRNAAAQGLKLAIFNSCDGLGLARALADLHIPQLVVMREPVPDRVAQEFLTSFLRTFVRGESLYLSVRRAREQLQVLENEFLCATWLPVICQNPAERPPTWQSLLGRAPKSAESPSPLPVAATRLHRRRLHRREVWQRRLRRVLRRVPMAIALSALAAGVVIGGRSLGWLQPVELATYDQMLRLRPAEREQDPRLLIVTIDEQEKQQLGQQYGPHEYSLSNANLNRLIEILDESGARVIGIDLYRDLPIEPTNAALARQFSQNSKVIGVCKVPVDGRDGIAPPAEIAAARLGFSDFVEDKKEGKVHQTSTQVRAIATRQSLNAPNSPASQNNEDRTKEDPPMVRRHLLAMREELSDETGCLPDFAFSTLLAGRYLEAEQIPVEITPEVLKLGDRTYPLLRQRSGGYKAPNFDYRGAQILLNYRTVRPLYDSPFKRVKISDVLNQRVQPDLIQDRLIILGYTPIDPGNSKDIWKTPIASTMDGAIVQAHMTSQLISAAMNERPLLWTLPDGLEVLWIGGWAALGGLLVLLFKGPFRLLGAIALGLLLLGALAQGIFIAWGGWLPLVPAFLAFGLSSVLVIVYRYRLVQLTLLFFVNLILIMTRGQRFK